jgi:hypothetical protein
MRISKQSATPFLLLAVICAAAGFCLWPELTPTPDLNDGVLHLTLIQGMAHAVEQGRNPFNFWSPEIGLGQPIARMYQPMGHALVVLIYFCLGKSVSLATLFLWIKFLAMVLMPLSFFLAAGLLELPPGTQVASALLCLLVSGDAYGIDLNSYVWAGHGLFPQLLATHFLLLTIGFGWQAIRHGRRWILPALFLAMTGWTNLLYGYAGALTLCLIASVPGTPWKHRARQLVKIGLLASICAVPKLLAWLAYPGSFAGGESGTRAWMSDSFGAARVLHDAFAGELLDHNRWQVLTLFAAVGIALALWKRSAQTTFLLTACLTWLLLFCGRPAWGDALYLIGITPPMPLHRLIGPVQLFAVLLAALALGSGWEHSNPRFWYVLGVLLTLSPAIQERRTYLQQNFTWAAETRAAFEADGPAIQAACSLAKSRGGRVFAGLPFTWGAAFRIGQVPVYALFPVRQIPSVGFYYISFDGLGMYSFDERFASDYRRMDVRTVIQPVERPRLFNTFLLAQYGRFSVYGVN